MKDRPIWVLNDEFFSLVTGGEWPLALFTVSNQQALAPLHQHDFNELVFIIGGSGTYIDADGNTSRLMPGNVFFLKPGMIHGYIDQKQLVVANIIWFEERLRMPLYDFVDSPGYHAIFELEPQSRSRHRLQSALALDGEQLSEVSALLQRIQYEQQHRLSSARLMIVSLFGQLLSLLCRYYCASESDARQEMLQMDRVIAFIQRNYAAEITRPQLARLAAMSETTFYRKFQQLLGCSPTEYLLSIRFLQVEKLLRTTTESLATIALRCGFTDGNHLSHMFKKRYGETPRHFRLHCRE